MTDLKDPAREAARQALIARRLRARQTAPAARITPRPSGAEVPLSYAQERVWFMDQLAPGEAAYHIAVPLRVNTDLNLTLNAEALSLVPGSLILEADRRTGTLYVHVIGIRSLDEVERFRQSVLELEGRIVAAVGSAEELDLIRRSAPTGPSGSVELEGAPT